MVHLSDEEVLKVANELRIAYKLKKTIRYAGQRDPDVHAESVAEHVFALLFLAQYFLPLEDPESKLSPARVYEILLFHDFGEILHGDVPYHMKSKDKETEEEEDAEIVFTQLPASVGERGHARWREYEDQSTPEAQFVYALDKIEPVFELMDPVVQPVAKRTKFTYEMHMAPKLRATEKFPVMRRFVEALSADLLKQDIFWREPSE